MRVFFLAFFCFFLGFSCFSQNQKSLALKSNGAKSPDLESLESADSKSAELKSLDLKSRNINSSIVEIPAGKNSLFTCVYYFDSMEDGAKIAEEKFGIENFSRFEKIAFTKLRRIVPGDKISAYEFGMFKSENEFWILKNAGDGWLWGKGFFLPK